MTTVVFSTRVCENFCGGDDCIINDCECKCHGGKLACVLNTDIVCDCGIVHDSLHRAACLVCHDGCDHSAGYCLVCSSSTSSCSKCVKCSLCASDCTGQCPCCLDSSKCLCEQCKMTKCFCPSDCTGECACCENHVYCDCVHCEEKCVNCTSYCDGQCPCCENPGTCTCPHCLEIPISKSGEAKPAPGTFTCEGTIYGTATCPSDCTCDDCNRRCRCHICYGINSRISVECFKCASIYCNGKCRCERCGMRECFVISPCSICGKCECSGEAVHSVVCPSDCTCSKCLD